MSREENKQNKSPDNLIKFSKENLEENLKSSLKKKFGERFDNYRKVYNSNIKNKKFSKLQSYPTTVILELVNRCNLQCTMCYQGFRNNAEKFTLDENMLIKIFDDFKENQLSALMLSISEPLLFKKIDRVFELAKHANIMDIFLFTNGVLLNKKNIEIILNSSVTRLFVSIDASSSEIYNKVRIPVSKNKKDIDRLKELEQNIKNFMNERNRRNLKLPLVRTSFVALDKNFHERSKFIDKWIDIVDSVEVQKETSITAYDDIKSGVINYNNKIKDYDCGEPWNQISIYSDGTVAPCCNTVGRNLPIGNIKNQTIAEIWNGDKMTELRKSFLNNNPHDVCKACINNSSSDLHLSEN